MLTQCNSGPRLLSRSRMRNILLCAAWMCGAPMTAVTAVAQNTLTVETSALGMTGWHTDPVMFETSVLGMTGWHTEPVTFETSVLGMTGWRTHLAPTPPLQVLSGTIDLRDPHGNACPRRAEAAISIRTNAPGSVAYDLDCTGGRSWSQTATAHETAPDTYLAVAVLPFDIARKEHMNCALKSKGKVLALRGRDYTCVRHGGGLIAEPEPPRVVDPPGLVCVGGRVAAIGRKPVRQTCHCPAGRIMKNNGPNSYRCEAGATVSVICTGGALRGGQCVCAPSMQRVNAGHNAWRCVPRDTRPGSFNPGVRTPARTQVPSRFQPGIVNRFSQGGRGSRR